MSETQLSYRFWGIPHSNMVSVYIHLNQMLQASGYRDAKGMGDGMGKTVINPLAVRCVNCGKLIQAGNLCKSCKDTQEIGDENRLMKIKIAEMELKINKIIRESICRGVFDIPGQEESVVEKEVAVVKKQFNIKT